MREEKKNAGIKIEDDYFQMLDGKTTDQTKKYSPFIRTKPK